MDVKQAQPPVWARRHAVIVALTSVIGLLLIATPFVRSDVQAGWAVLAALTIVGPAIVSALPHHSRRAAAAVSACALLTQAVFAVAVFGSSIRANVVLLAVLCVVALYEVGIVLVLTFVGAIGSVLVIALTKPALIGLSSADPRGLWITVGSAIIATAVAVWALGIVWRDQRSARHIAEQQQIATDAYLEVAGNMMLVLNRDAKVTTANRRTCLTLDREPHDIVGRDWFELALAPELRNDARRLYFEAYEAYATTGALSYGTEDYENEIVCADGSRRTVEWWATMVCDRRGNPTGMVCAGTDVTEIRADRAALERSAVELDALRRLAQKIASLDDSRQAIAEAAMDLTGAALVGIMEPDRTRIKIITTTCTTPEYVGHTIDLAKESSVASIAFLSAQPQFVAQVKGAPGVNQRMATETGLVSCMHQPIVGANGVIGVLTVAWNYEVPSLQERKAELVGLIAHEAAIALRRRESLAQLERAALIDPLTGVANRRAFDAELPIAMRRAAEGDYPLGLIVLDLNDFKEINDEFGHEAGDGVLIGVATDWAGALRAGDLLTRVGGDEFAVLLPTCDEHEMNHIIERLHRATRHAPGAGMGGAIWDGTETASSLIRRADRAQYLDKARRKAAREDAPQMHLAEPLPVHPRAHDPRADEPAT